MENKLAEVLTELGIDLTDENFVDTPKRVIKHWKEYMVSKETIERDIREFAKSKFPSTNREMVIVSDIRTASLCPHHLVPVLYRIDVGYIPEKFVVGLSKICRFAVALSKYPYLQETYTEMLASTIFEKLNCLGSIVIVKGLHTCMVARGVKQNAVTITSSIKGVFFDQPHAKEEFLSLIKSNNGVW